MAENPSPPAAYCHQCGARMDFARTGRTPWRPFGRREWESELRCPKCGASRTERWAREVVSHQRNPLRRLLMALRVMPKPPRPLPPPGRGAARQLEVLAQGPSPLYGLKGAPLGLRLHGMGYEGPYRERTELRYSASGGRFSFMVTQSSEETSAELGLELMQRLLIRHEPVPKPGEEPAQTAVEKWSPQRVSEAALEQATVEVAGKSVDVELRTWPGDPTFIVRLAPGGHVLLVAARGMTRDELLWTLGTLTDLRHDPKALAEHQLKAWG